MLVLFYPGVFLDRFGTNGRGDLGRVGYLGVGGCGADRSPCFAGRDAHTHYDDCHHDNYFLHKKIRFIAAIL